jgi:Mrp family chromosome partitioning ATPase/capsular polysaccharide biosynthesis protein
MELGDLAFALRRFWRLALAVPATAIATAILLSSLATPRYEATAHVVVEPKRAEVELRLVQFLIPSIPLEVGTRSFQEGVRTRLASDVAAADWALASSADTSNGLVALTASGLNPAVLPMVANAAASELIERRASPDITVRLLEPADGSALATPSRTPIIVGAAVLGVILGVFLAVVAAHLRPRFRRPEDVANRFNLRLLGEVPHMLGSRLSPSTPNREGSGALEFFRRIRMNVESGLPAHFVLAVVSYRDGDGKSTVTANLACAPTGSGRTLALVDANLERPELHRRLGVGLVSPTKSPVDGNGFEPPIEVETDLVQRVTLVSPAYTAERSADAVARGLPEVLRSLSQSSVLIDTPALSRSADSLLAARIAGRALLVVDIRRQTPGEVEEAVRLLQEAGVDIVGVVVNQTSHDLPPVTARQRHDERSAQREVQSVTPKGGRRGPAAVRDRLFTSTTSEDSATALKPGRRARRN